MYVHSLSVLEVSEVSVLTRVLPKQVVLYLLSVLVDVVYNMV